MFTTVNHEKVIIRHFNRFEIAVHRQLNKTDSSFSPIKWTLQTYLRYLLIIIAHTTKENVSTSRSTTEVKRQMYCLSHLMKRNVVNSPKKLTLTSVEFRYQLIPCHLMISCLHPIVLSIFLLCIVTYKYKFH